MFGRDIPGTSGTQTSGYPGRKLYASGLFVQTGRGRDVPGFGSERPGFRSGRPGFGKLYARNFGLNFRSLQSTLFLP